MVMGSGGGSGSGGWAVGVRKVSETQGARRTLAGFKITPCTLTQFSDRSYLPPDCFMCQTPGLLAAPVTCSRP